MKLPLVLLALSGLLLWGSFSLNDVAQTPPIVAAARPHQTRPAAPPPLAVRNVANVDVSAPPLFRAATAPAALAGPQPGDEFALVGLAGDGAARVALLRDRVDHQVFNVHSGESVRDWTVSETSERCVVLRKGRQRQNVCLS